MEVPTAERIMLQLDSQVETAAGRMKLYVPLGMVGGIGAGFGVYHGVKEWGFPGNDAYEQAEQIIDEATTALAQIEEAKELADSQNLVMDEARAETRQNQLEAWIAEAEEQKPDNYNPTLEGTVSGLAAIVVTATVAIGFARFCKAKAQQIRRKYA